jgi:hypothetical protein
MIFWNIRTVKPDMREASGICEAVRCVLCANRHDHPSTPKPRLYHCLLRNESAAEPGSSQFPLQVPAYNASSSLRKKLFLWQALRQNHMEMFWKLRTNPGIFYTTQNRVCGVKEKKGSLKLPTGENYQRASLALMRRLQTRGFNY